MSVLVLRSFRSSVLNYCMVQILQLFHMYVFIDFVSIMFGIERMYHINWNKINIIRPCSIVETIEYCDFCISLKNQLVGDYFYYSFSPYRRNINVQACVFYGIYVVAFFLHCCGFTIDLVVSASVNAVALFYNLRA